MRLTCDAASSRKEICRSCKAFANATNTKRCPYCTCALHSRLIFVCQGLELRDQRGWSPAFNSVVFNDIPCFKQLVRVGASIDGVDKEGMR